MGCLRDVHMREDDANVASPINRWFHSSCRESKNFTAHGKEICGVPLGMGGILPESPDSDPSDLLVAVDVLVREEPDEEEDDGKKDNGDDDEDDDGYSE